MLQRSLLDACEPGITSSATERTPLGSDSWVDVTRGFLAGADDLLFELIDAIDWRVGRRRMYDRELDDPRLSRWFRQCDGDPHPLLAEARCEIERRHGHRFGGLGLNLYRDGSDSVAFHSDRELRDVTQSVVAIVVLGEQRPFLLRPKGGGASIDLSPGSGDLVVMGGRCQADFEHCVPKTARRVAPRVSASWRWSPGPTPTVHRSRGYFESRRWRSLSV